ncbi:hypothetical protein NOL39_03215 [Acinetobacter baumannii]|uniref:hypothetical protein n=1 Tax=Acinetobacter baumannii TaxID=470 RepID=UPI002FBE75C8
MKDYLLRKLGKINFPFVLISCLVLIYVLLEVTNIEYYLNHAFTRLMAYVIAPILALGALIAIKDSVKNIFKKEALSEGIIIYILWWAWVVLLCLFAFAMFAITYKSYFE